MSAVLTSRRGGTTLLMLAVVAAFGSAYVAIGQHQACATAGYELGREQRRGAQLERELDRASRRVEILRSPSAALERAAELGLVSAFTPMLDDPATLRPDPLRPDSAVRQEQTAEFLR